MSEHVRVNGLDVWVEQVGEGPDVLLIGGLGDTVESWAFQLEGLADRYRLTAFDNRGAGRTAMPDEPLSMAKLADDAAGVLGALDISSAHVAGFSGGSLAAQELALRHPDRVRSLVLQSTWARADTFLEREFASWRWLMESAPSEREFLEWFYIWVYTPRAHSDGSVDKFMDEVLAFPHQPTTESLQRMLDAIVASDTTDRLPQITAPTLVLAGGIDLCGRPELGRVVAELIPDAQFEIMEDEAHQPFQERPEEWNAHVDAFWREVETQA